MKCPNCGDRFSLLKVRDEFCCKHCGTKLRFSSVRFVVTTTLLAGPLWLGVEWYLGFESPIFSFILLLCLSALVGAIYVIVSPPR